MQVFFPFEAYSLVEVIKLGVTGYNRTSSSSIKGTKQRELQYFIAEIG